MRKVSLLLAFAVASFSAFAQYNTALQQTQTAKRMLSDASENNSTKVTQQAQNKSVNTTVLYSFDFTGGLPAGWALTDDGGIGGWMIHSGLVQDAAYVSPDNHTINSTSGGEYLLMPVEYYNTQLGSDPPLDNTTLVDGDATVTTDWMDVTGSTTLGLQYIAWFRNYYGDFDIYVYINGDDVNLAATFDGNDINGSITPGNDFPGPNQDIADCTPGDGYNGVKPLYNITEAVGGTAITSVKIAFRYSATTHYVWSMDDIEIIDIAGSDLSINKVYSNSNYMYTINSTYSDGTGANEMYVYNNINYSEVPANMISNIVMGGYIHQNAAQANNAVLNFAVDSADVQNIWTGVSTTTCTIGTDTILHTDTLAGNGDFLPTIYSPQLDQAWFQTNNYYEDGVPYVFHYDVTADETDIDPSNNTGFYEYAQTWGRYSYHWQSTENPVPTGIFSPFRYNLTKAAGDLFTVNYDCFTNGNPFKIYGLRFYFPTSTTYNTFTGGNGVEITPVLLYWNPTSSAWEKNTDLIYENPDGSGSTMVLTEDQQSSWIYMAFDNTSGDVDNYDFLEGSYKIGFEMVAYLGEEFCIGTDDKYRQASGHFSANMQDTWYNLTSEINSVMIDMYTKEDQMIADMTLGIKEKAQNTINKVKVYPNPTTGVIKVKNAENSTINIYSIAGNLVKTVQSNAVSTTVDLSEFAKGTYLVKVVKADEVITTKINLLK